MKMNFDRAALKQRGNAAFQHNYWNCVLMGILVTMVTNGLKSSSGTSISNFYNSVSENYSIEELLAAVTVLIIILAAALVIWLLAWVLNIFLLLPLHVGGCHFFIRNAYEPKVGVKLMGRAFRREYYWNVVKTMFLRSLFTSLWSLLFIIPGIIKSYEYMMIPYLLADNPEMPYQEAFRLSKEMMNGNKWNAFVLDLSFIGWWLLSACTCGILSIFYVNPYIYATRAELYLTLRTQRGI